MGKIGQELKEKESFLKRDEKDKLMYVKNGEVSYA